MFLNPKPVVTSASYPISGCRTAVRWLVGAKPLPMRQEDVYALMAMEGVNNQAVEQVLPVFSATPPSPLCKPLTDNLPRSVQHFQAPPAPLLPSLPSLIPPSPMYAT